MTPPMIPPETPDEDSPEADAEWFRHARPAADVLPGLVGAEAAGKMLSPRRGRPPSASPKAHVNIRVDADVLEGFKRTGPGWQTRMNDALRAWLAARR